ncbi:hypothetical protein ACLI4Z_15370 [Natrialbaceae archaeon A-arb3/5]
MSCRTPLLDGVFVHCGVRGGPFAKVRDVDRQHVRDPCGETLRYSNN